ncbi:hypothetical protein RF11_05759 [Thelohanellus kitauei]|uniref:Uncharacterized protein n=1 Tax=Thelohanellus kitauei TaxID=669202 RepID=A0A0C2MXN3_THEKT|nr:hypothetical protein RF11_05759 [Thelohanellus kitauei]
MAVLYVEFVDYLYFPKSLVILNITTTIAQFASKSLSKSFTYQSTPPQYGYGYKRSIICENLHGQFHLKERICTLKRNEKVTASGTRQQTPGRRKGKPPILSFQNKERT